MTAMEEIEKRLRKMTIPQLEALKMIAESELGISTTKEIGDTTSTASYRLGAIITSLLKVKTNKGSLLLPAGRDPDGGMRWQLNEEVISREGLKRILVEMLI